MHHLNPDAVLYLLYHAWKSQSTLIRYCYDPLRNRLHIPFLPYPCACSICESRNNRRRPYPNFTHSSRALRTSTIALHPLPDPFTASPRPQSSSATASTSSKSPLLKSCGSAKRNCLGKSLSFGGLKVREGNDGRCDLNIHNEAGEENMELSKEEVEEEEWIRNRAFESSANWFSISTTAIAAANIGTLITIDVMVLTKWSAQRFSPSQDLPRTRTPVIYFVRSRPFNTWLYEGTMLAMLSRSIRGPGLISHEVTGALDTSTP